MERQSTCSEGGRLRDCTAGMQVNVVADARVQRRVDGDSATVGCDGPVNGLSSAECDA